MRGEVCRWLRHIFYLYVALINSFLNIFQRLSPPERAFLIKIFSHTPIMFQEKAAAKGGPAASAPSMSLCIQSLVPFCSFTPGSSSSAMPSSGQIELFCKASLCSAFSTKPWMAASVFQTLSCSVLGKILPCLVLCCFLCVRVGSHKCLGPRIVFLAYIYGCYTVTY